MELKYFFMLKNFKLNILINVYIIFSKKAVLFLVNDVNNKFWNFDKTNIEILK